MSDNAASRVIQSVRDESDTIASLIYGELDERFAREEVSHITVLYLCVKLMAHLTVSYAARDGLNVMVKEYELKMDEEMNKLEAAIEGGEGDAR